jgi:HAD superfamily hydrolase (TIGR01490 family)
MAIPGAITTTPGTAAIAFFDLDGTLIVGQTQQLLVSHLRRRGMVNLWFLLGVGAWFGAYKLGLVRPTDPARARGAELVAGWGIPEVDGFMDDFMEEVLAPRLYPPTAAAMAAHRERGDLIVVLSAALEPLVASLARRLRVPAWEGTSLEVDGGRYTGRLSGRPLYGEEKVRVARGYLARCAVDPGSCSAYADHESDAGLLRLVGRPVAVRPRGGLKRIALAEGWRMIP